MYSVEGVLCKECFLYTTEAMPSQHRVRRTAECFSATLWCSLWRGSQVGQRLPSLPPTLDPSPPPLIITPAHLVDWAKGCLTVFLLFLLLLLLVVLLLVGGSQLGQKLPHNAPILTPYSTPTLPSTPSPTSGSSSSSSLFSTYS